ncbi:MAG: hypothetical protein ACTSV3_01775 [Candidatus Thorarchaeota archaeon]
MTECEECKRYGLSRTNQVVYACALCGEQRCEDHAIWVPAHEFDRPTEKADEMKKVLDHGPHSGWYVFCGRTGHLPRGVMTRYGLNRDGGRIVKKIFDYEKRPGLESVKMWEVGVVEDGYEKEWNSSHYTPSCTLGPSLLVIAHAFQGGHMTLEKLHKTFSTAFESLADKKPVFYGADWREFLKIVGETPEIEDILGFACSRCGVVVCMNRMSPFYDRKKLKHIIRSPETFET